MPIKRGTFIEYRNGMINVSAVGRSVTFEERTIFIEYNKEHQVLPALAAALTARFGDSLKFSIGGQISVDCFPHGWDKRYCLQFVEQHYSDIHFFGDKCYEGGNDLEIYLDERTKGNWVKGGPAQTIELLEQLYQNY